MTISFFLNSMKVSGKRRETMMIRGNKTDNRKATRIKEMTKIKKELNPN